MVEGTDLFIKNGNWKLFKIDKGAINILGITHGFQVFTITIKTCARMHAHHLIHMKKFHLSDILLTHGVKCFTPCCSSPHNIKYINYCPFNYTTCIQYKVNCSALRWNQMMGIKVKVMQWPETLSKLWSWRKKNNVQYQVQSTEYQMLQIFKELCIPRQPKLWQFVNTLLGPEIMRIS
jgi:hypothetical protein